jgi:hypothetical protein
MLIIKYYEWVRFQPDQRQPEYELCKRDPSQKEGAKTIRLLDKETALKMIEEEGYLQVYRDKSGTIWEKEDEPKTEDLIQNENPSVTLSEDSNESMKSDLPIVLTATEPESESKESTLPNLIISLDEVINADPRND